MSRAQGINTFSKWAGLIPALLLLALTSQTLAENTTKIKSFSNITHNSPSVKVYKYRQTDGVTAFTDQVPRNHEYEVVRFDCYACNIHSTINWHSTRLHLDEFKTSIAHAAREHGVDPALVRALIHAESAFNPNARSNKGAIGLMQLMPATARALGVTDPTISEQNIEGGVKHLASLLNQYNGNITLATAAYNAGAGAVSKYNGVPPYAETQAYVKRVKILHERYRQHT